MASNARLYQQYVEVLATGTSNSRTFQNYTEVLATGTSAFRTYQVYSEVVSYASSAARCYHIYSEVLTEVPQDGQDVSSTLVLTQQVNIVKDGVASNTITFTQNTPALSQTKGVTQTLSLTQSVAREFVDDEQITSTLTLTQRANLTRDVSANNTLNLTQTLKRLLFLNASNTLTLISTALNANVQDIEQDLNLGQVVDLDYSRGRRITQNITFTQARSYNRVFNRNALNTLNLTQRLNLQRFAKNTLSLTSTALGVNTKGANNTITFGQDVDVEYYKLRRVFQNLTFTQIASVELVLERSLTNTITFNQVLKRVLTQTASNTISFGFILSFTNSKYITQTLTLNQNLVYQYVYGRSVENHLSFFQNLIYNQAITIMVFNNIRFRYRGRILPIRIRSSFHDLILNQELLRERIVDEGTQGLTFDQEAIAQKIITRSHTDNLNLTQDQSTNTTINLNLSQTLTFRLNRIIPVRIGDIDEIVVPPTTGTVIPGRGAGDPGGQASDYEAAEACLYKPFKPDPDKNFMILSVPERTVVLPAPLFGDRIANTDQFVMSTAMTGDIYTTVKKRLTQSFAYEWDLSYLKAEELAEFVWEHNARAIQITNWKGEIWVARITSNPIDFRDQLAPVQCPESNQSKFLVSIEFEGVRIH